MGSTPLYKYCRLTLWISISISILVHFSALFDEYLSKSFTSEEFVHYSLNGLTELLITFLICFLLFGINFFILKPFHIGKRVPIQNLLLTLIVSFGIVIVLSQLLFDAKVYIFPRGDVGGGHKSIYIVKDFFIAMVVIVAIYVIRLFYQNQQNRLEIELLRVENLQRQFDILKNQVSPHFLFNSLNSLKVLIRESPNIAQEYIGQLSTVLRYTLQNNVNRLVTLQEELDYINAYFFLLKLRYNENITLKLQIPDDLLSYRLPPLALQLLIENATKHNEISKRHPLSISIDSTMAPTVIVSNSINRKFVPESGTGLGLINLSCQFKMLSGVDLVITKDEKLFSVVIPLIKP